MKLARRPLSKNKYQRFTFIKTICTFIKTIETERQEMAQSSNSISLYSTLFNVSPQYDIFLPSRNLFHEHLLYYIRQFVIFNFRQQKLIAFYYIQKVINDLLIVK